MLDKLYEMNEYQQASSKRMELLGTVMSSPVPRNMGTIMLRESRFSPNCTNRR
jgi:hypothetical protein